MSRLRFPFAGWIKQVLPRSLLGRSLLIILIPLVALEAVALQIFYGSHLDVVSRRLSTGVAGEIAFTVELMRRFPDPDTQAWALLYAHQLFGLEMRLEPGATVEMRRHENVLGPMDEDLAVALQQTFRAPFTMDWTSDPRSVLRFSIDATSSCSRASASPSSAASDSGLSSSIT